MTVISTSTRISVRANERCHPLIRAMRLASITVLTCGAFLANAEAADLRAGASETYKTLAAAVAAANAGDRILLDAGTYLNDTTSITKPITIEGVGTGAILQTTQLIGNGKAILVVDANLTVRNVTFQGAQVTDNNGAGIRLETGDLTVDTCNFVNNQEGILANANSAAIVTITNSSFTGNGAGDGYSHAIYIGEVAQLTVSNSTFAGTKVGHDIKSRALRTTVTNTTLDDGVSGTTSYAVDLSNGGVALLDTLHITQGVNTQNPIMVAYGAEGNLKATNSLSVTNSTFINQLQSPSAVGVRNFTTTVSATLTNNTVQGLTNFLVGPGTVVAPVSGVAVRQGGVYSTAQPTWKSMLRIYNSGAYAGTAKITLANPTTAQTLVTWQSPSIAPNAAIQVPISTVESAATTAYTKPTFYSATILGNFAGSVQHVVLRSVDSSLANLTLCDNGLSTNGLALGNVHSSLLPATPSRVVIYNTGTTASTVTLGIYDARDGTRLGTYTSPSIAAGAESTITVATMEAAAKITPPAGATQYTMKVESSFTGTLQHLIVNTGAGLNEDLTGVCVLKAS